MFIRQISVFLENTVGELRQLMDAGACVAICSDNMSVSNTCVDRELEHVARTLGLSDGDVTRLLLNAVNASFADEATKRRLSAVVAG